MIKFIITLFIEVIKNNIAKSIMILCSAILFYFADKIPNRLEEYSVVSIQKVKGTYIYVYETNKGNDKITHGIVESKTPIIVNNGILTKSIFNEINGLLWVLFGILMIIVIIMTFINDSDAGWELKDCWKRAFFTLIYCEEENGFYYYMALGRLISQRQTQIKPNQVLYELHINGFKELKYCPKFQTKTQKRETLLSKLI